MPSTPINQKTIYIKTPGQQAKDKKESSTSQSQASTAANESLFSPKLAKRPSSMQAHTPGPKTPTHKRIFSDPTYQSTQKKA
ncbi:hypothetical protein HII31_02704 [Pseudocercospora fuligena]|uniref:Uncharacterized protein n=1 Tax=Pseudocercospora fuligena TaxID=685502 RepID=A0A8H6VMP4_9PEZI|nr:hypothetical protein HII31_02704 [Pseudocercospora fuligena]